MVELVIIYEDGNGYDFASSMEEVEDIIARRLEWAETEEDKIFASGEVYEYTDDFEIPETDETAIAIYKEGVRIR